MFRIGQKVKILDVSTIIAASGHTTPDSYFARYIGNVGEVKRIAPNKMVSVRWNGGANSWSFPPTHIQPIERGFGWWYREHLTVKP